MGTHPRNRKKFVDFFLVFSGDQRREKRSISSLACSCDSPPSSPSPSLSDSQTQAANFPRTACKNVCVAVHARHGDPPFCVQERLGADQRTRPIHADKEGQADHI